MSLFFYGVCILGVVLGGLVLVLYSLLIMAQRGDECLDQLELEMPKTHKYALPHMRSEKPGKLGLPTTADLYHGGTR
jgi:hypothetical protein